MRPRSNPGPDGTSADNSTCGYRSTAHDRAYGSTETDHRTHYRGVQFVQCSSVQFIQRGSGCCNDRTYRSSETDDCSDHGGIVVQCGFIERGFV